MICEDLVYLKGKKEKKKQQQSDIYDVMTSPLKVVRRAPSIYYHSVFARVLRLATILISQINNTEFCLF